ncbi:hypothetical protein ACFSUS_04935 [Spirosoma soli]|uniref:Replication initiation factor domain-containing protein n=1 Tax=Spirosoma soli TaxID=1770529 RepID=A0ABW5LYZ4_9BACT
MTTCYPWGRIHAGRVHYAMFDGIKIQDVSVAVDSLLKNDRLTFGALVDGQTGVVLNPVREADDRGLTFRLVPRRTGQRYRVEVKGSLHKFYNNGIHNADQYTANDLLLTLDQLVNDYGFNLFDSVINNLEFGVNLELPFPVSQVLDNLICYKNQPFAKDCHSPTPYYICDRQRYAVKLYDKGKQKGLDGDLLRFEIRVRKMRYFDGTDVQLRTLADLLNVANYRPLGALLVGAFNEILFDDLAINSKTLTVKERAIYQQCRNPRYWHTPDSLTPRQAAAHRQQLSRNKDRFRTLLNQHGSNWHCDVSTLIEQTWLQLTAVDDKLLTRFNDCKTVRQNGSKPDICNTKVDSRNSEETARDQGETCHKLTDPTPPDCHELTDPSNGGMSQINPLYSEVLCDKGKPGHPSQPGAVVCPVTGVTIDRPQPGQRFVSAAMLRNNDDLMLTLDHQHRQYAKGSKEDEYSRAAHNVRNQDSNRRNNLRRRLSRSLYEREGQQQFLFPLSEMIHLTDEERAILDYWKGTPYEVKI